MKRSLLNIILILSFSQISFAQDLLSIEDAIKIGLEKNYAVLIAKNDAEIAKAQNNIGAAGMSPQVSLNGNAGLASVNSHQEYATGVLQDKKGAASNNIGGSVNVLWTLFDGMKMFAVKNRLEENKKLYDLKLKQQMENTVYNIILAYYDIVRLQNLIKASADNLAVYAERKNIAKLKMDIGSDSKVDFMLSQSDENKAQSDLLKLQQQLITSKANLNVLLMRTVDTDFKTTDSIVVSFNPTIEELKKTVVDNNTGILISKQNELISQQFIKEARAANLPLVQLNGAYNLNRSENQAGFIFINKQNGLNAGLNASWLLFNGNYNNRLVQERKIRSLEQKYFTDQTKQQVDATVYLQYQYFLINKKILEMERINLNNSKEVLDVSFERYKLGKGNLLETKETQKNYEDAQARYFSALYDMKKSETELLRANGSIIK